MLQLYINDRFIPLDPGISIPFVLNNPMFEIKGSYSFAINIPYGNEIAAALGFIDKPDKTGIPSETFTGTLGYQGANKWAIVGYPQKATSKSVQLFLRIGLGGFYELTKDLTLQDLELGGQRTIAPITGTTNLVYPASDYALFPVKNENFFDGSPLEDLYADIIYQNYPSGTLDEELITPFPYVGYVMEQIFEEHDYTVISNIFKTHDELKKLCEFNLYGNVPSFTGPDYNVYWHHYYNLPNHLPALSIIQYLTNICNKYNIHLFINEQSKDVKFLLGEEIIKSSEYTDITDISSGNKTAIYEEKYDNAALISEFDSADEYLDNWKGDIADFYDRIQGEVDNVVDLDSLSASVGDVYLVLANHYYYEKILSYDEITKLFEWVWEFIGFKYIQNYHSGWTGNKLEIENGLSSLVMYAGIDERTPSRYWLVPILEQVGNNIYIKEKSSFGHRHLLYQGLQEDSEGNTYPLGSVFYNNYNNEIIGSLYLFYTDMLQENDNVYAQFWKNWLNWKLNIARTFERKIQWPTHLLFNFPWEKKFRIRNTNYFVKQIKVNLKYKAPEVGISQIVKC